MDTLHIVSQQLKALLIEFIGLLPKLAVALLLAALFVFLGRKIATLCTRMIKEKNARPATNLLILLEKTFRIIFIGIGLFVAFSVIVPSLKFSDLFAALGIGGVAIAFVFRDTLQNFVSGVIILLTRTFEVGDRIKSGPIDGTVEEITVRTTVVRTDAGDRVIVPNGLLTSREIVHRFYAEKTKLTVLFHVPVDAHLEAVIRLVKEIFQEMGSAIDAARTQVAFESMSERTITLRASWQTNGVASSARASKEYFVTRLQEELHRYGAHLGLLEEFTIRSYEGDFERSVSLSRAEGAPPRTQ